MIRKSIASAPQVNQKTRRATFVISTDKTDRAGERVVQAGLDTADFNRNPIALAYHNPEHVIGNWGSIQKHPDGRTTAELRFPPPGTSQKADEIWGLIVSGVLRSASIGFDVLDATPMDPSRPRGPQQYNRTVLREISVVAIPCNANATLIGTEVKAHEHRNSQAAKAARLAKATALQRRIAAEDARAGSPVDPARAVRIERARRLAAGERLADIDAPPPVPQVKQHDPDAARRAACSEAFLRVDANTQESRLRKAAAMAEEPGARERRVREAELALAQREAFQRRYGRD